MGFHPIDITAQHHFITRVKRTETLYHICLLAEICLLPVDPCNHFRGMGTEVLHIIAACLCKMQPVIHVALLIRVCYPQKAVFGLFTIHIFHRLPLCLLQDFFINICRNILINLILILKAVEIFVVHLLHFLFHKERKREGCLILI